MNPAKRYGDLNQNPCNVEVFYDYIVCDPYLVPTALLLHQSNWWKDGLVEDYQSATTILLLELSGCLGDVLLFENITAGPQSCVRKNVYYNRGVDGQISIVFPNMAHVAGAGAGL